VGTDDPNRYIATELRAPEGSDTVEIDWADGVTTRYTTEILRGFCPSAVWQGHQGPLRFIEGGDTTLLEIEEVGGYALRLNWPDMNTGIYSFRFLRALGEAEGDPKSLQFGR